MVGTQVEGSVLIGLLTLGVILLLVGLIGKVKAKEIEVGTSNKVVRVIIGFIGLIFTGLSLTLMLKPTIFNQLGAVTQAPSQTLTPQETQPPPTLLPASSPTQNLQTFIFSFQSCIDPCTGNNSTSVFPEKITKIYLTMQYQNIPANAHFKRYMKMKNDLWATYECNWPYASSGTLDYTFTEPKGIASGDWALTIEVNGNVVLQQTFTVSGNWHYWDPAGYFNTCEGKR